MRKKSIGEILRDSRQELGYDIDEVQRLTKIQAQYLQALEYNDFDAIPDQNYQRSFLKRYAEVLDLDTDILLDAYEKGELVAYSHDLGDESSYNRKSRRRKKKRARKKKLKDYMPFIFLTLLALAIIGFAFYIINRHRNQETQTRENDYSLVSTVSSEKTSDSSTNEISSSSVSSSSSSDQEKGFTSQVEGNIMTVSLPSSKQETKVDFSVKDGETWLSLTPSELTEGVTLSSEKPSTSATIESTAKEATILVGQTKGLTVTINGKNLSLEGLPQDQPVTIILSVNEETTP